MTEKEKQEKIMQTPGVETSVAKSLHASFFAAGNWPQERWWEIFQNPTLNAWMEKALANNPSLQGAEQRLEQAKQMARISRSRLFPYLFFDADDNWRYLSKHSFYHLLNPSLAQNGYEVDLSLGFTYEFDFWGKYRNLFRASIGEVLAYEAEVSQAKLILSSALAQGFFALIIHQQKKALIDRLTEVRQARYALQYELYEKALSSAIPPLQLEEQVQIVQQWQLAILDEVEIDTHLIHALMGEGPDAPLSYDADFSYIPPKIEIPQNVSLDLLSRRPDLMAQIWRVEALSCEVGAAKAEFFPNINIAAFAGLASVSWKDLLNMQSKSAGIEPALHLPIFTAGAIRAGVRAKRASFEQAVFAYNDLLLQSAKQVADLLSNLRAIYEQKQLQEAIVKEAYDLYSLSALRAIKGLDNALVVYEREEHLLQKQMDDLDLRYQQYALHIQFIRALGGGYQSPYIPIRAGSAP